ncbi:MAG TPA: GNAT family N-acetyltransferase, partial [Steroidobacteraceae bacterium]
YHVADREERLYVIRDGEQVIGCAPMRMRHGRLGLLAALDTDQPGILSLPRDQERVAQALIEYLCAQERAWGMAEFFGQRRDSALYRASHVDRAGFRTRDFPLEPYNEIALVYPDLRAYFQSLSSKMRSNIGRQARRLYARGDTQLVLADGAAATSAWFDAYCDLDRRSWKYGTRASIQRDPRRVRFYQEIVAGRGGLDPSFIGIVFDGALIAGLLVGSNGTSAPACHGAWCLEMAYDQSRADLGPGQLLLILAAGEAIGRGDGFLNFLQNFAYYKHRWNAEPIEAISVQLIRRASVHNLRAWLGDLKRRLRPDSPTAASEPAREQGVPQGPVDEEVQQRSAGLTAAALAAAPAGVRRLDRAAAQAYLPFEL